MSTSTPIRRLRVFVVDDNHDNLKSTALLLKLQGHDVATESSAAAAIDAALAFDPHVIFLDLAMPEMNGYEVARQMRQRGLKDSTAIVALTGFGQSNDIERTKQAGMDDHLVKPVAPDAFQRVLSRVAAGLAGE